MQSNKIIVPIDGSEHSLAALQYAIKVAKAMNNEIIILNVQPRFEEFQLQDQHTDAEIEEIHIKKGMEILQKSIQILEKESVPFEPKVKIGLPTIEIAGLAKDTKADCIVMGCRGLGPDVSKALGSVGYGVLHMSTCPLTLVPPVK